MPVGEHEAEPVRPNLGEATASGLTVGAATAVLGVEALGTIDGLRPTSLVALLVLSVAAAWLGFGRPARFVRGLEGLERPVAGLLIGLAALTLLTALVAPPNTWDSMTYHMARVAHWLDQRNVGFYSTAITRQLWQPPFAEYLILLGYGALGGRDLLANLPQWIAAVGLAILCGAIAGRLGASRPYQLIAAAVIATSPSTILQASSTQNDLLTALWLTVVAFLAIGNLSDRKPGMRPALLFGLALGLAWGTKGTSLPLSLPWVGAFLWGDLRSRGAKATLTRAALALAVASILNAGRWQRTAVEFGDPLGPPSVQTLLRPASLGPLVVASNLVTNVSLHVGTPWEGANDRVARVIAGVHDAVGLDLARLYPYFGGFRIVPWSSHEDRAGSPVHLLLAAVGFVAAMARWRRLSSTQRAAVTAVAFTGLVFVLTVRWQPYNSRLHLPLLALAAPLVGRLLQSLGPRGAAVALVGSTAAALPAVFLNATRPLLPRSATPNEPAIGSVVTMPRSTEYFNARPDLEPMYRGFAAAVGSSGCRRATLVAGYDSWEYPLWALRRGASYQHVLVPMGASRFEGAPLDACVVVALDQTPDWQGPPGYRLSWRQAGFSVWIPN